MNRLTVLVDELLAIADTPGLPRTRARKLRAKAAEIFQLGRSTGWDERSALADLRHDDGAPTDGRPVRPEAAMRMMNRNPMRPPGW